MNIENSTYEISKMIYEGKNNSISEICKDQEDSVINKRFSLKFDTQKDIKNFKKKWEKAINGIVETPVVTFEPLNTINNLCLEAFETAKSKGWHDKARSFGEAIALIHAEASEALEADRRNEGRERVAEELADICIRVFDASMEFGLDLETAIRTKMEYNKTRTYKHGNKAY